MKRPLIALVLLLLATIFLPRIFNPENDTAPKQNPAPFTISGRTMGTSYHVSVIPGTDAKVNSDALQQHIDTRLQEINQRMSTYIKDSELSRINQAKANTWVEVSAETAQVISTAQKISAQTGGAFDISVGSLVNLWGFGPEIHLYAVPEEDIIETILAQSGHTNMEVKSTPPKVKKHFASMYLDLSGIAKGYAVDQIAELLVQQGYPNHLVEIGGEIRTGGQKGAENPWNIGIERPQSEGRSVHKVIHTSSTTAMATSGDYRNYFEHQGRRYSHTIDPTTGYPISHKLAAVSVLHESCMLADAYATAFMVMGPEQSMDFAREHEVAIYMLVKGEHGFISISSPAFENFISSRQRK
ncbi:MAG: FAD:protein FMN transferase [Desulfuromonadaceae bacterium]|nr:FAD:protein FMN transferase [Geobacteraceae bacterium]